MPKQQKNEVVRCSYFAWRLYRRKGMYYADGRFKNKDAGRHSLGTKNKQEALQILFDLDRVRAEDLGLIPRSNPRTHCLQLLPLTEGWEQYQKHLHRPQIVGGIRESTFKKYRVTFRKFIPFAKSIGVETWNMVTNQTVSEYSCYLVSNNLKSKTIKNELVTLIQCVKWLIESEQLQGTNPITLKLKRAESQSPYCYRSEEVAMMIKHCHDKPQLQWLGNVIVGFACTGLRSNELASLQWTDLDLESERLSLTDETGIKTSNETNRRTLKSGRNRSFPLNKDLLKVLKEITPKNDYVFLGPKGRRLFPSYLRQALVQEVILPLKKYFPSKDSEQGFKDGRIHSFRHYFCSMCSNNLVPERIVMKWLGHTNSDMINYYYHLHDEEAKRQMNSLNFLGETTGCSFSKSEIHNVNEAVEPHPAKESEDVDNS